MNTINFKCSECHQSLEVDAGHAGTAVACPQCGQTILVPQLARVAEPPSFPETPLQTGRWWPAAVVALLLLAAGLLFWQRHGRASAAPVPSVPANLARGLVLYFNFHSKPSAGKVPDLSGHGNNGEAVNVQWTADGHRGGACVISPTDSHIRVSNNESLNPPEFTLCTWIKTSSADHAWHRIFDKGLFHDDFDLSVAGDWDHWKPATKYRGFIQFEMPKTQNAMSDHSIADGQWHQVTATYDGQEKRLFLDGQLQQEIDCPGGSYGNNFDLVIGGFTDPDPINDNPHTSFDGSLDEVMMFNRALSPDEVQALYNSQKTASDQ